MTLAHPAATQMHLAVNLLDAQSLLAAFGTIGIAFVLFAETGLLIGFFLPGDSLLFTAGLLCAGSTTRPGHLSLPWVLTAAACGALAGAQTGYLIGRKAGPAFLARTRSAKIREGAERAADILHRYGHAKAIVLARFLPIVRTVLNPLAGVLAVPARVFTLWQVLGGLLWTVGLVLAGYALGASVPAVDRYLLPIIAAVVAVSLVPIGLEVLRSRRARQTGESA
ncbi:membrane-associated protein [Streptomyces sp. CG 926]|uniref:DedA family protein n=1 Tax=Streptomyces sp. CG 926 TaxID=1882405 RepID=UPI000D6D0492|nr:DedA family protein [Streptomyces sp. CG 926]PWK64467.1 membrane-associated protein [Streptomyces sp. CG 926]